MSHQTEGPREETRRVEKGIRGERVGGGERERKRERERRVERREKEGEEGRGKWEEEAKGEEWMRMRGREEEGRGARIDGSANLEGIKRVSGSALEEEKGEVRWERGERQDRRCAVCVCV